MGWENNGSVLPAVQTALFAAPRFEGSLHRRRPPPFPPIEQRQHGCQPAERQDGHEWHDEWHSCGGDRCWDVGGGVYIGAFAVEQVQTLTRTLTRTNSERGDTDRDAGGGAGASRVPVQTVAVPAVELDHAEVT